MSTAVFLQVRLDSSRLPRKALLKLGDISVVEHAMSALNGVPVPIHMVLTTGDSIEFLAPLAEKAGWDIFAGPKEDVLARFILAARQTGVQTVVRATGDNPLVSATMAIAALKHFRETEADYTGFKGLPVGSGVEVLKVSALEEAFAEATDPYEREHVAPFLYRRPERFRIETPLAPPDFLAPDARITLDTQDDYETLKKIFDSLYRGRVMDLDVVVPYLRSIVESYPVKAFHAG